MDNVIIDGGLDLVRARPATLPGRIRECLNYEVGWRRGMTRIDGFERFDGQTSPSSTTGWVIDVAKNEVTGTFTVPETLTWTLADGSGSCGTLVAAESAISTEGEIWRLYIVFRAARQRPVWECTISGDISDAYFLLAPATTSVQNFADFYPDHKTYIEALDGHANILRSAVHAVPGGGTIVGLHFHEDQLYAIRDMLDITVAAGYEGILEPGMYVTNSSNQTGLVMSTNRSAKTANIAAVDQDGFNLIDEESISVCQTIRFNTGSGEFNVGDDVLSSISGWTGKVAHVGRRDGSLTSSNALGVASFYDTSVATLLPGESLSNQTSTGSMLVEAIMYVSSAAALTVESIATQAGSATLWRSSDTGWEPAATNALLEFENGTIDPFDPDSFTTFQATGYPSSVEAGTSTTNAWTGDINNIKVRDGATIAASFDGSFEGINTVQIEAWDFQLPLLEDDLITGMQVDFFCQGVGTSASSWRVKVPTTTGLTPVNQSSCLVAPALYSSPAPAAPSTWWGIELTPQNLISPDFGIEFYASAYGLDAQPVLDSVSIIVTGKRTAASKLYLWEQPFFGLGSEVGYINVTNVVVESGEWAEKPYDDPDTDLASGHFVLKDWSTNSIPAGTQIRTAAGGLGDLVATVVGTITLPTLPGSKKLDDQNSRYEMISYNFFASEDTNAIYGCSGAGPAFWYDGETLDYIDTGVGSLLEMPRHVANHQSRLCLGYKWGEVYVSDANGPTSFNGQFFAASYGFGDKITGLMPISGDALGVFTESATHVLIGNNGGLETPRTQVVNHKVGAIEYTVQSMGNRPIFSSFRGIETLETMDQYSDFFTAPLTYDVSPWLLERLQTAAGLEASDKSVVNSVVVRNKNQYRLFFADGYVLTLTYVGPEKTPQSTTQRYGFNSDQDQYVRVYATASGVTSDGRDRAFISAEARPPLPFDYAPTVGEELSYVYELDRGRSFDGGSIDAYFDLTYYFFSDQQGGPNVSVAKKINAFQVHGTCPGTAHMRMSRSINYEDMDTPDLPYEELDFGYDTMAPEDQPKPKYTKGRMTARGFAVSVRIAHSSAIEFPHTIQLLTFSDDKALKQDL